MTVYIYENILCVNACLPFVRLLSRGSSLGSDFSMYVGKMWRGGVRIRPKTLLPIFGEMSWSWVQNRPKTFFVIFYGRSEGMGSNPPLFVNLIFERDNRYI